MKPTNYRSLSDRNPSVPILLPKLKFGPKTSISPPISFQTSQTALSLSSAVIKPLPDVKKPQNFLDQLIEKYSNSKTSTKVPFCQKIQRFENLFFSWSIKQTYSNIPCSRVGATLTQIGSEFYLFGGQCGDRLSDVRCLNYEKLSWKTLNISKDHECPEPRDGHIALAYKNSLLIYGGAGGFNEVLHTRTCSALLHILDIPSLTWKVVRPTGRTPDARRNHGGVIVGSTCLIFGGINNNSETLGDFQSINLESMQWFPVKFKKNTLRIGPRHSFSMTSVFHSSILKNFSNDIYNIPSHYDEDFTKKNSGVYLFGGMGNKGQIFNDLFLIQSVRRVSRTDKNLIKVCKIEATGTVPLERYGHAAGLCGKYLVVVGGRNDSLYSGSNQACVSEVAAFNITSFRWELIDTTGNIPPSFWGIAGCSLSSKLICFGGMNLNSFASNDLWVLETSQDVDQPHDKKTNRRFGTKKLTLKV